MSFFTGKRKFLPLLSILFIFMIILFCTKKSNPVAHDDDDDLPTPTLSIITPSGDTSVDYTTDSLTVKAIIANSDNIDSLKVNGKKVSLNRLGGDTVSIRCKLDSDTANILVAVYYQKTASLLDSVTVFKKAQVPAFNGMAKISGTLLHESTSPLAKRLAKTSIALNAQGTKSEVDKVLPVSGADVMVYDAKSLSTSSDTTVKTDSAGNWAAILEPGEYFVFAVYFDREKLEIVTTSLPDITAEKDKETKTDSAIAISDDINPMLLTFIDAAEANGDHVFVGSNVPKGLPLVMSFSEPMTRASAGDSLKGIVLGLVESDTGDLEIIDTIGTDKLWSPDGKELRLVPRKALTVGKMYKVYIPSSTKDLALNKLDNDYSGIFTVTEAVDLPPFALKATVPADKDTIQTGMPVECIFTRPVDGLSLNKNFTISSETDSLMSGFFEAKGTIARFVNKFPWQPSSIYTMTIRSGAKDLMGDSLGKATSFTFTIRPKDAFEQKIGVEGLVAMAVKEFTGAYIAGDIDRFSQSFHPSFELIDASPDGQITRKQLATFLEKMRDEVETRNRLSKYGIIDPVFYYPEVNGKRYICWKLIKNSISVYYEDLGNAAIGVVPHVFDLDKKDVSADVKYINRGIIYKGETLYFAPDMTKSFIDQNARENDPTIFGKLLKSETNVETRDIMMTLKNDFVIKNLSAKEGSDTAFAMIELISEEQFLNGQRPGPIADPNNPPPNVMKRITALQTKMIFTSGKWLVVQIAAKEVFSGDKAQFNSQAIADTSFAIKNFAQTGAIEFVQPKVRSISVKSPVKLEWSMAKSDGVGGFIVAIANEMSGGNLGLLIFTRKTSVTIGENGSVDSTATILSLDPKSLSFPLPRFGGRLTSLSVNDSDVYVWKVVAVKDTSASSFTAGMQINIIADSDFGSHQGIGIFTLLDKMPNLAVNMAQQVVQPQQQVDNRFSDKDGDMFPDWIEKAFGTSADDPGSYPNFTLDSDLDGYADFMEQFAGSKVDDAASMPEDVNPKDNIPDMVQKRPEWRPELNVDDDKDGFPNEVEMIFGTDPWNAASKPAKSIKASVPVNTYFGGIKLGDQGWKRINLALLSDSTGDFAFVKNTELEGIARSGADLSVKLFWNNGEFVFFLGFVNGPNTGKFLKVRFHREGNNLRGPIDLADTENGGGPWVGEFFASLDSITDFNNMGSAPSNPIVNPNPQGPLNLGPPPADRVKRPDSGSTDMRLALSFTDVNLPVASIMINNDSTVFEKPFWAPGQFPALGGNAPSSPKQYRIEGNLNRIGNSSTPADTLVLIGIIEFNKDNGSGGTIRQKFDYILFITGISDPKKPSGIWKGWYTQPMGPINEGPKPFIGSKDSVDAALSRTNNTGVIMQTQQTVTISSAVMEGTIWTAKADTQTFFIMEKMGDFASVMVKDFNGKLCIVLSVKNAQGNPNPNPNPNPNQPAIIHFTGDSGKIVQALATSGNKVKVAAPNPFNILVDPATLRKEKPDGVKVQWVASDPGNQQRKVIFLAVDNEGTMPRIEENTPVVTEIMSGTPQQPTGMIPFAGDSTIIRTALDNSGNKVTLDAPNAPQITINPASLQKMQDPANPQMFGYAVTAAGNPADVFIFMAVDQQNPDKLRINGTIPVVQKKMM